jgi:hypothetical protein
VYTGLTEFYWIYAFYRQKQFHFTVTSASKASANSNFSNTAKKKCFNGKWKVLRSLALFELMFYSNLRTGTRAKVIFRDSEGL